MTLYTLTIHSTPTKGIAFSFYTLCCPLTTATWRLQRDHAPLPTEPRRTNLSGAGGNGLFASFAGDLLPRVGPAHGVLLEPFHLDVHFEQLVTQLAPAVGFARGHVETRRDPVGFQRAVHLDGLRHRDAHVLFPDEEDRRRLDLPYVLQRGIVPIHGNRRIFLPGRPAEPGRSIASDIALGVHRYPVARSGSGRRRFETVCEGDHLVGNVYPGAPSHCYEALRIRNAALDQVIHSR